MDWLENKWDSLRKTLRGYSLEKSIFMYLGVMLLVVLALSIFTQSMARSWLMAYIITNGNKEGVYELLYIVFNHSASVYIVIGIFVTIKIFIKHRIRPALAAIENTEKAMEAGDYHIEVNYQNDDEMGELCRQFEAMRKRFVEEKKQIWKMQEEQRQINAVFAHDMRTPLTVIEGYTEFLLRHIPQKHVDEEMLMEKLTLMKYQEERLYEFSKTMSRIQKMEELQMHGQWHTLEEVYECLEDVCNGIVNQTDKDIRLLWNDETEKDSNNGKQRKIFVDTDLICEVFENLLSNALRYAKEKVSVNLQAEELYIRLTVMDDGNGFSESALKNADKPYYTEEKNSINHFGIGLSICRQLAEKHSGSLKFINSLDGGAVAISEFGTQFFL